MEGGEEGYINMGKSIIENVFSCNAKGGIHRSLNANDNVPAPKILYVSETEIVGIADPEASVEVYVNKTNCTVCQGLDHVGLVQPNNQGKWTLQINANISEIVTATQTLNGSTSEFSSCKRITESNDEPCINEITALELFVSSDACDGTEVCASTYGATDSSPLFGNPTDECYGEETAYGGTDIWFSAIIPWTGNLMIRQRAGTDIDVMMEAYSGDCFSSLKLLDCANFYLLPTHMIIKADDHGLDVGERIFFRVYDTKLDGDFNEGNVSLSAHTLPRDEADWVFCDEGGGTYPPTEFIVTFKNGIHPDTVSSYIKWMEEQGGQLSKQCSCAPNNILLWNSASYVEMEGHIRRTQGRTKADTTNYQALYNYFAGDFYPNNTQGNNPDATGDKFESDYNPTTEYIAKVGIVDTGVDPGHPALNPAIWVNPNAGAGCVKDNDDYGFDFSGSTTAPEPYDLEGHGAAVNGVFVQKLEGIQMELINSKFYSTTEGKLFDAVCGMYYQMEQECRCTQPKFWFKN